MTPAPVGGVRVADIPRVDVVNLCRTTLEAVERFYQDPQNLRRFERWMAEREAVV